MQTIEKKKLSLDMRLLAYPAMATAATMFSAQDAEATAMLDHYNLTSTPLDNDDDCAEFGAPCHILAVDVDGGMAYDVATEKAGDPDWDPEGVDMALFSFTAPKDAPPIESKTVWGIAADGSVATKIESNQLAMSFSSGVVIGDDENFESDKALFSQQLNLINPGQDFLDDKAEAEAEKVAAGSMLPGQTGFLGFQFMADPSADILNAYAMVRPNTDGSITLIKTGYDDQGGAIKTVPVPGPLALMALGAAGIAGLRRRQKK